MQRDGEGADGYRALMTTPTPADRPPTDRFGLTLLEVFAEAPLGGNLHAVLHDADALSTETMARFSARMRLSETSFLTRPGTGDGDYRHRIFTVAGEIPFAGHPSLGAAAAFARAAGRTTARLVQQTGAGTQELAVELDAEGSSGRVELVQNPPVDLGEPDPRAVLAALGLGPDDARRDLPAAVVSTGLATLVLPVTGLGTLARVAVDLAALGRALESMPGRPVTCYVVVALGGDEWRARCFTGKVAGGEDAATGSAAGPLMAYASDRLGRRAIAVSQGEEIGSPSRLYGRVVGHKVAVAGAVRVIGEGTIELPTGEG